MKHELKSKGNNKIKSKYVSDTKVENKCKG